MPAPAATSFRFWGEVSDWFFKNCVGGRVRRFALIFPIHVKGEMKNLAARTHSCEHRWRECVPFLLPRFEVKRRFSEFPVYGKTRKNILGTRLFSKVSGKLWFFLSEIQNSRSHFSYLWPLFCHFGIHEWGEVLRSPNRRIFVLSTANAEMTQI